MHKTPAAWVYWLCLFAALGANVYVGNLIFKNGPARIAIFQTPKNPAVLITTPSRDVLLVNTGPDASIVRSLGETLPFWKRALISVVITSPTSGSMGGLPSVLAHYNVPSLIRLGTQGSSALESAVSDELGSRTVVTKHVPYGTRIELDSVSVDILSTTLFEISYGKTKVLVSTSTPSGTYISNGGELKKVK